MDHEAIKYHVKGLLTAIGEDVDRPGLIETPERVARMLEEVLEGIAYTNDDIAHMFDKTFEEPCNMDSHQEMVMVKDLDMFSYCEHHLALMYDMKVTIAYLPKGKVIGLSKIARIAEMVGKRLQLQERIGKDIAYIIEKITGSEDVAVLITASHSCMTARGIKNTQGKTTTTLLHGKFKRDTALQYQLFS